MDEKVTQKQELRRELIEINEDYSDLLKRLNRWSIRFWEYRKKFDDLGEEK